MYKGVLGMINNNKTVEQQRREKLISEKPYVMDKIFKYEEKRKRGESTAVIDFCFDYKCNMNCKHCSNSRFAKKDRAMTLTDLSDFFRQADKLGLAQASISGGEPLVFDDLDGIVEAINPKEFHISLASNGILLDKAMARHLKEIGVDKIKLGLDSIDKDVYAQTRRQDKTYDKAMEAIFNASDAGLQVAVTTVVTHQNARTENTERLAAFCQENGFNFDIMVARAVGAWEGNEEVLIDEEDAAYFVDLNKKYPLAHRDTFPTYGETCGSCGCVNKILHLTKYGDIMPCTFVHIAIGNIFEEPLEDIIKRGQSIKHFAEKNPLCLSGEDRNFIRNYMSKFYGKPLPIHWSEAFSEEDFIEKV